MNPCRPNDSHCLPDRRPSRRAAALLCQTATAAALILGLGTLTPSYGAGVTAHVVAGELVLKQLEDPDLRDILTRQRDTYLGATGIPDELLQIEQTAQKIDSHFGSFSHGTTQGLCDAPRGYEHQLWRGYQDCMKTPARRNVCEIILATLFGVLTHEVTDAPWHHYFIDRSSADMCEPCQGSVSPNGNHSYVGCNPGGPKVNRDPEEPHRVTSGLEGRHIVADSGIDLCLASRLRGNAGDLPNAQDPILYASATRVGKAQAVCPSGSVFDLRNGGECWKCPSGWTRTGYAVDGDKACTSNFGGGALAKAGRRGDVGCGGDQFRNAKGDKCYSCPGGYSHNSTFTVDTKGVCFKKTGSMPWDYSTKTADYQGPRGCPSGQFENAEGTACYGCPSGYEHNPAFTVDTPGVCYKGEQLSKATFAGKASLCPSGGFIEPSRGECWSCPGGYLRNVFQGDVTKENACSGPGLSRCSLLKPPDGVTGKYPSMSEEVYPNLVAALLRANVAAGIASAAAIKTMVLGASQMNDKEPEIASMAASPAVTVCSGMLAHGIDGPGALADSAREAAAFLNAFWRNRNAPEVTVISFADYEKAIVSNHQVLYRNHHRPCKSDGDCGDFVCRDSQCVHDTSRDGSCAGASLGGGSSGGSPGGGSAGGGSSDVASAALTPGSTVALYSPSNHRFIRVEPGCKVSAASQAATAVLPASWAWERLKVVDAGGGSFGLYSDAQRCFIRMNPSGVVDSSGTHDANLPADWAWERFQPVDAGGGQVALYSPAQRRFLRVQPDGVCNSGAQVSGPQALDPSWAWERLSIVRP